MSEKKKPNRHRTKTITIRVTQEEYDNFQDQVKASDYPTTREFILGCAGCRIFTDNDKKELQELSLKLADYQTQLRGMATNLNQLAYKANAYGQIPNIKLLQSILNEVQLLKRQVIPIWESIRLQIKLGNTRKHSKNS